MIRFIATADTHVHPFRGCSKNGGADRREDGLRAVEQTLHAAEDRGVPWVHCGDVKQVRGTWDQESLSGMLTILRAFPTVPKFMISGNGYHDGLGVKTTGASGLDPFRNIENMIVITKPTVFGGTVLGAGAAFWPWQPNLSGLDDFKKEALTKGVRLLFAHGFLREALVGPEGRNLPDVGTPMAKFGLVGPRKHRVFDYAVFGDIHKHQQLGDATLKKAACVWYPGSPYAQNWSEQELEKGCLYLELLDDEWHADLVTTEGVPRFRVLKVEDDEALLQRMLSADTSGLAGDFIRIAVRDKLALKYQKELLEFKKRVGRYCDVQRIPTPVAKQNKQVEMHSGLSPQKMIEQYVATVPPPEGTKVEAIVEAGKRLL